MGGIIIYVFSSKIDEKSSILNEISHKSETQVQEIQDYDYIVHNSSTIKILYEHIDDIMNLL